MSIELSSEKERKIYRRSGAKIFYRRSSKARLDYFEKKHTRRGVTDWNAVTNDLLRETIDGWEGVTKDKKEIPFDPDLIMELPPVVHSDLIELIAGDGSYDGEDSPEKNSQTSSSGK
jgi:hypothetical protein